MAKLKFDYKPLVTKPVRRKKAVTSLLKDDKVFTIGMSSDRTLYLVDATGKREGKFSCLAALDLEAKKQGWTLRVS